MNKNSDDASVLNVNSKEAQAESYQQISRLCLFFEAKGQDDYQEILSFLSHIKSEVREVKSFAFCREKVDETVPGSNLLRVFGKKDFNLFKQKKASLKDWLAAHEFDVLICFADDSRDKNERIIKDVKAKMKVGPNFSGPGKHFNISIGKPGEKMDFEEFYKQVKHYISQLNIDINR